MTNITKDPDLKIREELLSLHAINPFIAESSAPRCLMLSGHLSQLVTIEGGSPQIIQTGIDPQLADNTFSRKIKNDSRVMSIIKRYNGVSANSVTSTTEYLVIVEDIETNMLDVVTIPTFHKLHQYFGFKYNVNEDLLSSAVGMVLPKDTVLADSPSVTVDSEGGKEYSFGCPLNLAYLHVPEVTGDGIVISESATKKFRYKTYETIVMEFGESSFPLNLYGDKDNYKIFPDIGEYVNPDRVVAATRKYDSLMSPCNTSSNDVRNYSAYFDKPYYSKSSGGKVVDIRIFQNKKSRKSVYTETTTQAEKYVVGLTKYYADIISAYDNCNRQYRARNRSDIPVSPEFHRLLVDAYVATEDTRYVRYTNANDIVDLFRVELIIEHDTVPDILGAKASTIHGSKGVIVKVVKNDSDMPVDANGIRADVVFDPTSIPSRMNPSNLYEHYFSAISRKIKSMVTSEVNRYGGIDALPDNKVGLIFEILTNGIKLFGTEQYEAYLNTTYDERVNIIKEVINKECYVYYKISSKLKPYQVVMNVKGTEYEPVLSKYYMPDGNGGGKWSHDDVLIAPQYIILLAKTPETYLATSSAKTNHYDMPIPASPRTRQNTPYRNSPVKILSETGSRLYSAYVGRSGLAEMKDRANSIATHKIVYESVLCAERPTDVDTLVNRAEYPFGTDKSLEIANTILNTSGIELEYVKEK